ncbi:MAG TPA: hypothetical protein VJ486_06355 [Geothrix sp.]|nr:hypothetical protein [Geothrix sp.]
MIHSILPLIGLASLAIQAPTPVVPPCQIGGMPNARFEAELDEAIRALVPLDRREFFKALRAKQRELQHRIFEVERGLQQAQSLRNILEREGSPNLPQAQALVEGQARLLATFREMDKVIARKRWVEDPLKLDADELKVDLYGGFQFSSLFSEQDQTGSFFSKSRPFVALDIRQTFRRPAQDTWWEVFSTLSFQSSSFETKEALNVITSSGQFHGDVGLWWMKSLTERVSWGLLGSAGLVGYSQPVVQTDLSTGSRDEFRNRYKLGLTTRQEEGALKGSFAECSYVRDPLFRCQDRLFMRGRVVLTQFGSQGASGDFYMEGSVNKGRSGKDEAVMLVGFRLSTVAFFRSLGGGAKP